MMILGGYFCKNICVRVRAFFQTNSWWWACHSCRHFRIWLFTAEVFYPGFFGPKKSVFIWVHAKRNGLRGEESVYFANQSEEVIFDFHNGGISCGFKIRPCKIRRFIAGLDWMYFPLTGWWWILFTCILVLMFEQSAQLRFLWTSV